MYIYTHIYICLRFKLKVIIHPFIFFAILSNRKFSLSLADLFLYRRFTFHLF